MPVWRERSREGNDLYLEMGGVLPGQKKPEGERVIDRAALIYGQMNEPPGARARVGLDRSDRGRIFPR